MSIKINSETDKAEDPDSIQMFSISRAVQAVLLIAVLVVVVKFF